MKKLSNATLSTLGVAVPRYDRSLLSPGILHVGVGNFHRAHQAIYLERLQNEAFDPAWGLSGAGVRAPDAAMRAKLAEQDWLFTVVEVDGSKLSASVVGCMTDFITVDPATNAPLIAAMTNPATRIVSLTVTEGGYFVDSATGQFDLSHPLVAADITHSGSGHTVFGAMVSALAARRLAGTAPFTVMSCDNLPGNGDAARAAVLGIAQGRDADLAKWIADHVTFPNAMVDRITPATGERERSILASQFGIEDNYPVFCEPFMQWVLEDSFADGRPALDGVGVTLTSNIHDFEMMKIRILNGGHAILCYPAALMGIEFAHEALQNQLIRGFLRKVLEDDVLDLVPTVPGYTPAQYVDLIFRRIDNAGVADQVARLCHDGSNRQPKFTIPSMQDDLARGHVPVGLALAAAFWCRYCAGHSDAGTVIAPNDPDWPQLQKNAEAAQSDPESWLDQSEIYGGVGQNAAFRAVFAACLRHLNAKGTEQTLRDYLNGSDFSAESGAFARNPA
jgi:mannitol 2-dehydrogenase